ncbi:hypothetical protein SCACP_38590 [Sporomusa carbonis]
MDLVEITITQAERRKAQQQLIERRRAQWCEEGAELMERRLNTGLTATYVARQMEIDVKRLRRLERGEPVKQAYLLRKSYENVLAYQEKVLKNEQLAAEVAKLRSQLHQTNVIVEVNAGLFLEFRLHRR